MGVKLWRKQLALCTALTLTAIPAGCQSARSNALAGPAPHAQMPPLSTSPSTLHSGVVTAGGPQFSTAPAQLTTGTTTPVPLFVPDPPDISEGTGTGTGTGVSQNWVSHQSSPVPAPHPVQKVSNTEPVQPVANISQPSDPCLPSDTEWRQQMEERTAALLGRLTMLEGELDSTRSSLTIVNQSLLDSKKQIDQLNRDVEHWKNEVQRVEADMKAQQVADLKSLDDLTETMHQVLMKQRTHATHSEGARR